MNNDQFGEDNPYVSRRGFFVLLGGAMSLGIMPQNAVASLSANRSVLGRGILENYAWSDAVAFWRASKETGALRGIYVTLGADECKGLSATEIIAEVLAELSPLADLTGISFIKSLIGVNASNWSCSFMSAEDCVIVISLRQGSGMPIMVRGEYMDLEVCGNTLVSMSHQGENHVYPAQNAKGTPAPETHTVRMAQHVAMRAFSV